MLAPAYEKQRSASEAAAAADAFESLVTGAEEGDDGAVDSALGEIEAALEGFRAAPLSEEEELRRAGQLQRFLALVPIEYERGVDDGRVTLDFEIQEAVTFRDGAAQAFGDLEHLLALENQEDTRRLGEILDGLAGDLGSAARHEEVADPEDVQGATDEALELIDSLYPDEWKEAGATADFDVIAATLDRLESAMAAGQFSQAEQARLEAYAFFEFGPEQRLRGLANDLFVEVEGLFWYGADGLPGLAQLVKRKAEPAEVAETREALDLALADAEAAVGAGPTSNTAVISNTAIIVFREGLEAVLILAALMAGMVGAQAKLRKPLLWGAAAAFVASVATWGVAQTLLGSLSRYGEKLEAIVSLVAIGVLLLILNWFYHRVYWGEHLAGLHSKKKKIIGIGVGAAAAQIIGLTMLGFTSVYREGFETVLFLQAIVLEAGAGIVLIGVAIGLAATLAVGYLTIRLQRKLPHKKMLVATGLLILWVLVVMVGTTVQTMQVVGWIPVTPVEGLRLPYWAGLWLGIFPTWEGLLAQASRHRLRARELLRRRAAARSPPARDPRQAAHRDQLVAAARARHNPAMGRRDETGALRRMRVVNALAPPLPRRAPLRRGFAEVAEEHLDDVHRYLLMLTADHALAEDLSAETFEKAFRSWRRYDPRRASERTWLCRIARNVALDHFRSESRRRRREERYALEAGHSGDMPDLGFGPELEAALRTLSAGEREVLALRVVLDLDSDAAARVLGIGRSACSMRLTRALGKLEERMAADARA